MSQCSTHVTPTMQRSPKTQSARGALYTPARLVRRQTSGSIRPQTKPKRAWTPTPCHCQRASGECTAKVGYHRPGAKQPGQPRAVPRVPHQTQNQWASAHHNTKPNKAWTPNPKAMWKWRRPKDHSSAHSHADGLQHQRRAEPPLQTIARRAPACSYWICHRREKTSHARQLQHRRGHGTKTAGKSVSTARVQSSPATPGQHSETRNRPKINGPALTTTPAPEVRLIPKKNYTNGLKWPAILTTKGYDPCTHRYGTGVRRPPFQSVRDTTTLCPPPFPSHYVPHPPACVSGVPDRGGASFRPPPNPLGEIHGRGTQKVFPLPGIVRHAILDVQPHPIPEEHPVTGPATHQATQLLPQCGASSRRAPLNGLLRTLARAALASPPLAAARMAITAAPGHDHMDQENECYKQAPTPYNITSSHPPTPPSGTAERPRGTLPPPHHPPGTTGPLSTTAAAQRVP